MQKDINARAPVYLETNLYKFYPKSRLKGVPRVEQRTHKGVPDCVSARVFEINMAIQNIMSFQTFIAIFVATVLTTTKPGCSDTRRAHYNKDTPVAMYSYQARQLKGYNGFFRSRIIAAWLAGVVDF